MKIIKGILNVIFAFLLVIITFIVLGKNILSNKLLNKNYMLNKMEEMQVYLQISRDVQSGFENYIYQSGLPEDTINNLYTDEMIRNDTNSILEYIYDGTEIKISDDIVRANLEQKIVSYVEGQNLKLNDQGRKNISDFEDLIVNEYKTNVNIDEYNSSLQVFPIIHNVVQKLQDINQKIWHLPIIALLILLFVFILINRKNLLIAIQYLSISSLSIGVILKLTVNLVFKNFDIDNIVLFSTAMTNLVINIIKEILYSLLDNSNIFVICGIVGIIVSSLLKNISTNKD